ncbi:TrkH family potassium uptake protein [Paludifilum halophilum]|uniref:Ktr system potassium uptake protein D n=1 Tax=Paludifilum halophilum TaxID=1642702 RepID=A0A235B3Z7_9BACL|nr:TrkH family potassium uptake protein [Paludifilum halophilum]OYD06355.1 Ktr system potassium uptake protein D [Paludifilum halophilum]
MKFNLWKITPVQLIVLTYLIACLVSSFLLMIPAAHRPGVELSYLDSLFTAVSAISVTGLTTVNTAETYSPFGVVMLMAMIQFGGIGFMSLGTFLWMATGRRIGIQRRRMIMIDQNRSDLAGLVRLARDILLLTLLIEMVGALLLGTYFYITEDYGWDAFYYGAFASLSAFTNAGFDIFGNSLADFADDYFVQILHMILMTAGAIGFPVLIEAREWIRSQNRSRFRFSLFTKITVTTFFTLMLLGLVMIWLLERQHFYADMSWHQSFFYSFFNSATTRSAGLSTMDVGEYTTPTQLALSFLMFVGASPSSVGGGIRTTTLAVIVLSLFSYARGQKHIRLFRRELIQEDVQKASVVFVTAILLVSTSLLLLLTMEGPRHTLMELIFEVSSAFGTTGLSMGITGDLTAPGKLMIILLMFIGRIGILSLLFLLRPDRPPENFRYPREQVIIG